MSLSKRMTRRESVLLVILGVLLLCAVYFLLVHRPVTESVQRMQQQSEDVSLELSVLEIKKQRMDAMQAELDEVLQQPNTAQIPRYDNLEQVMAFLNALLAPASDYKLSFDSLPKAEGQILRRTMSLTFTCDSYEQARNMVVQMQNCPYRCQLGSLSIAPASGGSPDSALPLTEGAVTVSLRVTFFESTQ